MSDPKIRALADSYIGVMGKKGSPLEKAFAGIFGKLHHPGKRAILNLILQVIEKLKMIGFEEISLAGENKPVYANTFVRQYVEHREKRGYSKYGQLSNAGKVQFDLCLGVQSKSRQRIFYFRAKEATTAQNIKLLAGEVLSARYVFDEDSGIVPNEKFGAAIIFLGGRITPKVFHMLQQNGAYVLLFPTSEREYKIYFEYIMTVVAYSLRDEIPARTFLINPLKEVEIGHGIKIAPGSDFKELVKQEEKSSVLLSALISGILEGKVELKMGK